MTGKSRVITGKIEKLLKLFPAVLVLGPRQCGKTTLVKNIRPDWHYFDLERPSDHEQISSDPEFFFKEHPAGIIIDQAQISGALFAVLRTVIDQDRGRKGRFLLTGSSSPELVRHAAESLAGRVGIVELGTFKMCELHDLPLSPLYDIFASPLSGATLSLLKTLEPPLNHDQVIDFFLRGGYPEPLLSSNPAFPGIWMENYFRTYIDRDIRSLFPGLDLVRFRRFIAMLASLNGTIINKAQLGRSLNTSEVTVRDYLDIAHGSYLWRTIPSFRRAQSASVLKMPKGMFRDSGFCHFLQHITTREQLLAGPLAGQTFEAFVSEELIKGLSATMTTGWEYAYYRTRNGAEVDLVLEGDFGILPVEIKFGISTDQRRLTSLKQFLRDNDLPLGIVINNSDAVTMLAEKIIQIPAGLL